jgi:centromere protein B
MQNQSYRPLTPTALTANSLLSYSSFDHPYSGHPQVSTTSHAYDHRPPSPALSTVSSRSDLGHHDTPDVHRDSPDRDSQSLTRPKPKKAKLTNALRKEICLYQQHHPHQKQEEIAQRFGVERSTVSKILKEKKTWLNIEDGVAEPPRHR